MLVKDWFNDWLADHLQLHAALKLPEPDSPDGRLAYRAWQSVIIQSSVHSREPWDQASQFLLGEATTPRTHLSRLVEIAKGIAAEQASAAAPSNREAAELASKNCDRCGGGGLACVYHPRPSDAERIPVSVGAYCVCAFGRWMRDQHARHSPDVFKRTPDLAEVLAGRSVWLPELPMTYEEMQDGLRLFRERADAPELSKIGKSAAATESAS